MSDPKLVTANLPPIEFTIAKSMRERSEVIYDKHLDDDDRRMDGAQLSLAADVIERQATEIESMTKVFRAIDKQPLMRGMVYNWINDDPNCAISQMDFEAAMHAALEVK